MATTAVLSRKARQRGATAIAGAADVLKCAFFSSASTIDENTTGFTATNEVTDPNCPTGGVTLSGRTAGDGTLATGYVDYDNPSFVVGGASNFVFRKIQIHNVTTGESVIVVTYDTDRSRAPGETVTVLIPESGTGVIRIGP